MIRMPVPSVLDRWNGSSRATRHLLIRARSASGLVARGGHVTSSGSQPRVCRRPARTSVLPTPRCPRWAHHNPLPCGRGGHQGAEIIMPDNGICERFHRTVLDEFFRVAFQKRIYRTIDELQADLDAWLLEYNEHRPHQGRWCFGKTPMQTFLDALPPAKEKLMAACPPTTATQAQTADTDCQVKSQLIHVNDNAVEAVVDKG